MSPREKSLRLFTGILIFLTFDLMLLGAGVRALNAGLTCPDWPLCFGQAIPKYHFGVYLEFIHRVIAGLLFFIYSFVFFKAVRNKETTATLKKYFWIGMFLLIAQVIMGGLTVLALLKSIIVTTHLTLAASFLVVLVLIRHETTKQYHHDTPYQGPVSIQGRGLTVLSVFLFIAQFLLGGFVASTYAGTLCLDFPLCNGQWVPTLEGPLGIQVMHRFSAYALASATVVLFTYFIFVARPEQKIKVEVTRIFLLVLTQVMVGILNLKYIIPAWLTVIHLGVALLILMALCRLCLLIFDRPHEDINLHTPDLN